MISACYFSKVVSEERVGWQVCTLTGHTGNVYSVVFSADGKHVASGSSDALVKIWDAESGAEVSSSVWECVEGGRAIAGFGAGFSIYCSGGGVREEDGLAGDGPFEYGALLQDRPGREACRQRGIGHVRQDLERRDRSRGERLPPKHHHHQNFVGMMSAERGVGLSAGISSMFFLGDCLNEKILGVGRRAH